MFSEKRSNVLHGILLIALFSCSAFYIAEFPFVKNLSFSPLIVGILLGMVYANSLRNHLPETWVPGILFCTKQVLRAGIVLYGFRLTFQSVDRDRASGHPDRCDYSGGYHIHRFVCRAFAENG